MNGPSDEIGPIWQGVVPQSPGDIADIVAGLRRRGEPVEDAPLEGQEHLEPPLATGGPSDEASVPPATIASTDLIGYQDGDQLPEEDILLLRDGIPRSTPKSRRDRTTRLAREARAAEERRKRESLDPIDRLEVLMMRRLWGDFEFGDEPLEADELLRAVLEWLRENSEAVAIASFDGSLDRVGRWIA